MRHANSTPSAAKGAAVLSFGLLALVSASEAAAATAPAPDAGHYPSDPAEAVLAMRPYNDVAG